MSLYVDLVARVDICVFAFGLTPDSGPEQRANAKRG
jgi:hypothetical protein